MLQLEVAGSLELGLFPLRAQGSGPQVHHLFCFLNLFLLSGLSPPLLLPFPGGDDWASGGAICHVFAQPFAGDEHPPGMPAFLLLCETEHP
ncbi:hypothetical protein C2845_PM01G40610 [Panicum miliaceum]|uniref:Uncharacterized protein n=1 Tax=Panicum miliaceum TaxID=4540 RepID=A0A3L6TTM4_PANMI|nr:hypothetical protein C2845_PM01G40610 [Panicum miliaceum]